MPGMSDGDSVSSIPDDMLFGSGSFVTSNTEYGDLSKTICHHNNFHFPAHTYIHEEPQSHPHNSSGPNYVKMHGKSDGQIIPDSEICSRSSHNNCSLNEALDTDTMHIKRRKCHSAKAQEREFIVEQDNLIDAAECNLRTEKYADSDKSVSKDCQISKEIANCKAGQTRETIKCAPNFGYRLDDTHEEEPLSDQSYYTCYYDLQNQDQFNNETVLDDFCSVVEEPHKEHEVLKASKDSAHITQELKDESVFAQVDSHCDQNLLISQKDNHMNAESSEAINSAKSTDMFLDSLNTSSFDEDDLEQDTGNLVFDVSADCNACDKAVTKEDTTRENALTAFDKGRTNKELENLDLSRDDQNPKEMTSIVLSDKSNERLEIASLEVTANTTSGLHSDQSARLSDIVSDNTVSSSDDYAETRVKELRDDFELSLIYDDYVQQLNRTENQLNKTSDPQNQNVSTDPNSLEDLRALYPDIPGVSMIYGLRDDIKNIWMEESHSHHHLGIESENGINVHGSERRRTVPGCPVQLQEIYDDYSQHENGYSLENYIFPSHSGIYFQQGANRLLVGDTERSMEGPFEINTEVSRNGRSEESIIYGHANEFQDVKVEAYDTYQRETDLQVNDNEPSHSYCDLFGGYNESSALEGMSSTAHQDSFEISPAVCHNEKTAEVILPVHTTNSFLSRQSINETPKIFDADSSYQANDISGEISVPVQEAIGRSRSHESLHRHQVRPVLIRRTSCPSTESEINSMRSDEEQQRDLEYALELQLQLNHEILMEDEAFARRLDNSQRDTLSPPTYISGRFYEPQTEEMINLNPQRMQRRREHPRRHRKESSANRDAQSNRDQSSEDMISLHETNRRHSLHSDETFQGNLQDVMQQRGAVAGANVADSRIPFDSDFQSVRQSSARVSNRNRPVPHRFEPNPAERVERIPGQLAQIDRSVITPLTWNYHEERRPHGEQLELRLSEHQRHYLQPNRRIDFDLGPNADYPSLDINPSIFDPDEYFETEDRRQFVSITQDPLSLRRFQRTQWHFYQRSYRDSYDELWNFVEMLGEVRQQGLDQTHIEMLPVHTFSEGNSGESRDCNICLSAYCDGDEIRTLTCLHMFHTTCIDEWLNRNAACPVCRRRIEIEDSSQ
ncbi:hypothetical protein CHS0354_017755 [Potamilus streckersoni]|uniref:RING-type domain-containing protein n=1 Tax=Potamilus streckersoni TaxID=2493646 RepID=A0AAE0W8Y9_9BIVA|nr:hypothetical protein CHS0354_017755 [Potamilus streckersoni]